MHSNDIPDISVVIPAYNEIEAIPQLVACVKEIIPVLEFSVQFVFIDDGSTDGTFEELCKQSFGNATTKVVKLSKNYGAHTAIRAGVFHADSDKVMVYSMDMPEPFEDIVLFYQYLMSGYEIVYSERVGYKGSLGSRIFSGLVNRYIEPSYPNDGLIGVAFGRKVKEQLNRNLEKNSSVYFHIFQLGFNKKSFPVQYYERNVGVSKWTRRNKIILFIDSFVMYSFMPIRAITGTGVIMAVIGMIWALFTIAFKLFNVFEFDAGWPTLMIILLFGFGITNISLGIIAEYLVRTLDAARERPTFITDEVYVSQE